MHKKILLIFLMLSNTGVQAVSPNTPGNLAMTFFALGSYWSVFGQHARDSSHRFMLTLLGSALVYYISGRYTPHNKFASARAIKQKVENDTLFRSRNESNAALREVLNNNMPEFYPCLYAIKFLYYLFTDLEVAQENIRSALVDLPDDVVFEQECKKLIGQIEFLQEEIEICVKRIMRTTQWYDGVDCDGKRPFVLLPEHYLDSFDWSINLISPEILINRTYMRGFVKRNSIFFSEFFLNSLIDLTE